MNEKHIIYEKQDRQELIKQSEKAPFVLSMTKKYNHRFVVEPTGLIIQYRFNYGFLKTFGQQALYSLLVSCGLVVLLGQNSLPTVLTAYVCAMILFLGWNYMYEAHRRKYIVPLEYNERLFDMLKCEMMRTPSIKGLKTLTVWQTPAGIDSIVHIEHAFKLPDSLSAELTKEFKQIHDTEYVKPSPKLKTDISEVEFKEQQAELIQKFSEGM